MPSRVPARPAASPPAEEGRDDPLFVRSVEKALRVLTAFSARRPTLSLSQLAMATGLDKSAAQRFAHTLLRLGYLRKDSRTKHFELTSRTLAPAYHYTQSNPLVRRAVPYLVQLAGATEEATNLSMLEGTDIVFVARFVTRHVIASHVTVGTHSPAFCTAPGIAMLSHLPAKEAQAILDASTLRPFTPHTTWRMPEVQMKLQEAAARGYAVCSEEILINDISVAAPILDGDGRPVAAVNVAVSKLRCDAATAERQFAPLVVTTAQAISG